MQRSPLCREVRCAETSAVMNRNLNREEVTEVRLLWFKRTIYGLSTLLKVRAPFVATRAARHFRCLYRETTNSIISAVRVHKRTYTL